MCVSKHCNFKGTPKSSRFWTYKALRRRPYRQALLGEVTKGRACDDDAALLLGLPHAAPGQFDRGHGAARVDGHVVVLRLRQAALVVEVVVEKGLVLGAHRAARVGKDKVRGAGGVEGGAELGPLCHVGEVDVVVGPAPPLVVVVLGPRPLDVDVVHRRALGDEEFRRGVSDARRTAYDNNFTTSVSGQRGAFPKDEYDKKNSPVTMATLPVRSAGRALSSRFSSVLFILAEDSTTDIDSSKKNGERK